MSAARDLFEPVIRCGQCGHEADIDAWCKRFTGFVNPVFVCPQCQIAWQRVFVKAGWGFDKQGNQTWNTNHVELREVKL